MCWCQVSLSMIIHSNSSHTIQDMTKHIPNFITCLNLFSGCVGVYYAFQANYDYAFYAILLSSVFDFLDGFAARWLHAYSPMGKELDSLADMISFGLIPGAIVFSLLGQSSENEFLPFLGFVIPVFSGLRLAKFNIDERQSSSFIGLPTPANAIFFGSLVSAYSLFLINYFWILPMLSVVFSILLVSELPMFSLKFKNYSWNSNRTQYLFLIGCVLLFFSFQFHAFTFVIAWYIVLSVISSLFFRKQV
jgi:CDP-diacylglycerol--serine O-phosphatidyltransferase